MDGVRQVRETELAYHPFRPAIKSDPTGQFHPSKRIIVRAEEYVRLPSILPQPERSVVLEHDEA